MHSCLYWASTQIDEAGTTTLTRGWSVLSDMIVKRSDTVASAFCPVDHQAFTT
jgi:hypothetical protein